MTKKTRLEAVRATAKRGGQLGDAIEVAYQHDIWPSAKNLCILMGHKTQKMNGRQNRQRKAILRKDYGL